MKVLIVEDDLALSDIVSFTLRRAGFETAVTHDGLTALERWQAETPDLIILDLNLPKLDGCSVCRRIHSQDDTPIIILSVRDEEDDIVNGLALGADDYVVKPFSPRQLVARIEAVLRRTTNHSVKHGPIKAGDFLLDPVSHKLWHSDRLIASLTPLETRLLEMLIRNGGQVIPADSLIDYVWGPACGDRVMLKQLIYRLRRKIDDESSTCSHLEAITGVGYSFVLDAPQVEQV